VTAVLGGTFFFVADDGTSGQELWASDGTEAGTRLVKDVRSGAGGSEPRRMTVAGGRLFFTADDGTHGRELWVSDGTEAGTVLVADLQPGADSSLPRELAAVGNAVIFSATDGTSGVEPWASDGTWARRLGDLAPGALSSSPVRFTPVGDNVYFGANDGTSGFELWSVPRSALQGPLDFYTVPLCRLADTRPSSPLLTGQPRTFPAAGSCGIPAEARAVAVNLTAVGSNGPGYLVAWPSGTEKPETADLIYLLGVARSSNGVVELGSGGQIDLEGQTFAPNGQVHFVLDVMGYFR
jgi:ELWxxDGT repeat protein